MRFDNAKMIATRDSLRSEAQELTKAGEDFITELNSILGSFNGEVSDVLKESIGKVGDESQTTLAYLVCKQVGMCVNAVADTLEFIRSGIQQGDHDFAEKLKG